MTPASGALRRLRATLLLVPLACQAARGEEQAERTLNGARADASAFLEAIPAALERGGPASWLDFFEDGPAFFMASDGQVAFATRAAARDFLASFAPSVATIRFAWHELRVEPHTPALVSFVASYAETITMHDGTASAFGGCVTGVARRISGTWRLQHLHWSSPVGKEP